MALDSSARESNLRDSVKKFFLDNIETPLNIPCRFDTVYDPESEDFNDERKWIIVNFGNINLDSLSSAILYVNLYTRNDDEGFKMAQLRDTFLDFIIDDSEDSTNGYQSIPFYKSSPTVAWEIVSHMVPLLVHESINNPLKDGTKTKYIIIDLQWGAKV